MYGGAASVASKKPVHVPSRKNLCPCNVVGRLAFAYAVQVNKHSRTRGHVSGSVDVCVCWLNALALNGLHMILIIFHC
ncbi:hypothetical protein MtrunA17_Chr0c01g0489121 [Medicago truncatula]|uniref:Uncharacterized protein n=1 Tax=Medicago truncatula TaxID=3880 RepID=A0A396G9F9_MEDTR|nr:hypothetical protein MtrunA17_Chr0c01g0489121 [Medicago truncatula]